MLYITLVSSGTGLPAVLAISPLNQPLWLQQRSEHFPWQRRANVVQINSLQLHSKGVSKHRQHKPGTSPRVGPTTGSELQILAGA